LKSLDLDAVTERDLTRSLLASPIEEERLQGLKALARIGLEQSMDAIYKCLSDESWRVRKEAVELFLSLPRASELASEVIELLHAEENAGLRNAAVEILVRLGRHSLPSLHEELSCSDHDVRKFVLDILGASWVSRKPFLHFFKRWLPRISGYVSPSSRL